MKRITLTDLTDNNGDTITFELNGRLGLSVEASSGPRAPTNHTKIIYLTKDQAIFLYASLPKLDGKAIPSNLPAGCEVE